MQRLRHNAWGILILLAIVGSFVINKHDTATKTQQNAAASVQRSEDTCRRGNPGRAYLQLRAAEFTKATDQSNSFTTKVSPQVWAILNCRATVLQGGRPIPLSPVVQDEYLRLFSARLVPVTRGDRIVDSVPFNVYFSGHGTRHP